MAKRQVSRTKRSPKSFTDVPDREIINVKMFRMLTPAFIFIFLAAGVVFYAQAQISKQMFLSPGEGETFLDVPASYWYWIIGLSIFLIILLVVLIVIVLMINSKQAQQTNEIIRDQAKRMILDAKKSGYDKSQIISKFREKGWSDSEISQVLEN